MASIVNVIGVLGRLTRATLDRLRPIGFIRQDLLHFSGVTFDHTQIGGNSRVGMPAALFPALERRDRNLVSAGELFLSHAQRPPDCLNIRYPDKMLDRARRRLATGMRKS